MEQGEERENGFLSTVPERFCRFRLRARKEITSAFETARKLPRFDRSQGVGVLVNTSPLAIVEPRGFGAVSNWEVIPKQLEELVFRLRQNPGDQRSQTGLYCLNTNPFAIFDPREFSRGPKTNFLSCLGINRL